jgi:DNA-binding NarL/FixJ family response regulator
LAIFEQKRQKQKINNMSFEVLTNREKEILEQLAKGMTRNQIANQLFVSPETIKKHVQNVHKKLEVRNKIEALYKMKLL